MDYSIHVRTPSDEVYQKVVDALSPLGVEIVAGETDPLVMAIFYLSRMNTKLDNLGQLRHLHKVQQAIAAISAKVPVKNIFEEQAQIKFKRLLYHHLEKIHGFTPSLSITEAIYLTDEQITALFEMESP